MPPPLPDAGLQQHLDAQLPPDLPLVDSSGRPLRLGETFGDRPVLLVLGYYHCTQLCGLLMHGLLEALHDGGLPRSAYRIVRVSIDPADTPATASALRTADLAYADFLEAHRPPQEALDLRLLTGAEAALRSLAHALGWRYRRAGEPDGPAEGYAHPAVAAVLTPDGRVSRYLPGVRFDPAQLRLALVAAGEGRIGGLSDRLALLCAHLDARLGRHSAAVLQAVRVVGLLTALALLAFVARQAWPGRKAR
ncbi:SCO family protein [Azohydromonas sp. G-1-1-14]|uniref:SCO family protein n=1 Tax=Azohydromonas caseinilytica TaxID=2728836 RepID=A0A848FFJ5_9BURK|nr:SCO family protein [Azohydromonas caseinilytica]